MTLHAVVLVNEHLHPLWLAEGHANAKVMQQVKTGRLALALAVANTDHALQTNVFPS